MPMPSLSGVTGWFLDPIDTAVSKIIRGQDRDLKWIKCGISFGIFDVASIESRIGSVTNVFKENLILARKSIADLNKARLDCYLSVLSNLSDDIKAEALLNVHLWEDRGLCWSGYISGWRKILNSANPEQALLDTRGELSAYLQNSPLAFCMNPKALEDYLDSLKLLSPRA